MHPSTLSVYKPTMATAAENVTAIENAMVANSGVELLEIGGKQVRWDRESLMAELEYWRQKAAAEAGNTGLGLKINALRPGAAK